MEACPNAGSFCSAGFGPKTLNNPEPKKLCDGFWMVVGFKDYDYDPEIGVLVFGVQF